MTESLEMKVSKEDNKKTRRGAPGHSEKECYSKDPGNLLLHPPRGGWRGGPTRDAIPDHIRLKYSAPMPRNPQIEGRLVRSRRS